MPDEIDMTELRLMAEQLVLIGAQILAESGFCTIASCTNAQPAA
jgi:hypothetical protein